VDSRWDDSSWGLGEEDAKKSDQSMSQLYASWILVYLTCFVIRRKTHASVSKRIWRMGWGCQSPRGFPSVFCDGHRKTIESNWGRRGASWKCTQILLMSLGRYNTHRISQFQNCMMILTGIYALKQLCYGGGERRKIIPVTGSEGPQDLETRLPHFLDSRLTLDDEVVSLTLRP
jgi:hypothetical protein